MSISYIKEFTKSPNLEVLANNALGIRVLAEMRGRQASVLNRACFYSAPTVICLLAPKESYAGLENALITVAMADRRDPDLGEKSAHFPEITLSFDAFQKAMDMQLESRHAQAILCNLYSGVHVFVIVQSDDRCMIFQSYMQTLPKPSYTLSSCLDAPKLWNKVELVEILKQIVDPQGDPMNRARLYLKLFFVTIDPEKFALWDSMPFPLVSASTKPFLFTQF